MDNIYIKLTKTDRKILDSYCSFIEDLGTYIGEGYEIVIHSLESLDHSAIKVIHGFHSGRKEGAPITDLALQMLGQMEHNSKHALYYFNKSKTGSPIKSTTIPLLGENQRIIGLVCINFYTETSLSSILSSFLPKGEFHFQNEVPATETFSEHIDDLIEQSLIIAKENVYANSSISTANRNKEIIALLYEKGIFNLKDSVIKVASLLNISKNTVYMHIRNFSSN